MDCFQEMDPQQCQEHSKQERRRKCLEQVSGLDVPDGIAANELGSKCKL